MYHFRNIWFSCFLLVNEGHFFGELNLAGDITIKGKKCRFSLRSTITSPVFVVGLRGNTRKRSRRFSRTTFKSCWLQLGDGQIFTAPAKVILAGPLAMAFHRKELNSDMGPVWAKIECLDLCFQDLECLLYNFRVRVKDMFFYLWWRAMVCLGNTGYPWAPQPVGPVAIDRFGLQDAPLMAY